MRHTFFVVVVSSLLWSCGGSPTAPTPNPDPPLPSGGDGGTGSALVDDEYEVDRNGTLVIGAPGVLENDNVPAGVAPEFLNIPSDASFLNAGGGGFEFTPPTNFVGNVDIEYRVAGISGTATAHIVVKENRVTVSGTVFNTHFGASVSGVAVSSGGVSAVTDGAGKYSLLVEKGGVTLSFAKSGYGFGSETVSVSANTEVNVTIGDPWPPGIVGLFGRLPVHNTLLFKDMPGGGQSEFADGVVIYRSHPPERSKSDSVAHEVCHGHQAFVAGSPEAWPDSEEGQSFRDVTGWRREDGRWVGGENPWSGFPDPIEDMAEAACAAPANVGGTYDLGLLSTLIPERLEWARDRLGL